MYVFLFNENKQKIRETEHAYIKHAHTAHTQTLSIQHSSLKKGKFQRLTNIEGIGRNGEELQEKHRATVLSIESASSPPPFFFSWDQNQMVVQEALASMSGSSLQPEESLRSCLIDFFPEGLLQLSFSAFNKLFRDF